MKVGDMKTLNSGQHMVFENNSSSAIGSNFAITSADPTNLASMMMYTRFIVVNTPIDDIQLQELELEAHKLDEPIEDILNKFDPAIRELTDL